VDLRKIWHRVSMPALAMMAILLVGAYALADPVTFLPPAGTPIQFKYNDVEACTGPGIPAGTFGPCVAVGDVLTGLFTVTTINGATGVPVFWASGISDGTQLNGIFTGLTVTSIVAAGGGFDIKFSGGTITMYDVAGTPYNPTSPANPLLPQLCGGACPAPWLTANFTPGIIPGDLTTTLFSHVSSLTSPVTGHGNGNLTTTGGTAFSAIANNLSLSSDLSTCPSSDPAFQPLCSGTGWPIVSHDPVTGVTAVPEPGTLVLLGVGMAAFGLKVRFGRQK